MRVVSADWFRVLSLGVATICGCHAIPSAPTDAGPLASESASGQPTGQWYVAVDAEGTGTQTAPFGRIQDALDVARPGDAVVISGGTYRESIVTRRDDIRLVGAGDVTVTASGRVVDVGHSTSFENLAFDGQFGTRDTVRVRAHNVRFLRVEVLNSGRDGIDVGNVSGLVVEDSHIHDCLWPGRDAHGIVGGRMTGAVVRRTRIHDVTGDGIQLDSGRAAGDWELRVEDVDIWDTGEDGIDTKTSGSGRLTVVGGTYRGFRNKTNSAAFNLKESVTATIDGVTVTDANIGFRLRHPADVRLSNSSIADSDRGIRYEDGIVEHSLVAVTFDNVSREIQRAN